MKYFDRIQVKLGLALVLLCGVIAILVFQYVHSLNEQSYLLAWTNIAGSRRLDTQVMLNQANQLLEFGDQVKESNREELLEKIHDMDNKLEKLESKTTLLNHSDHLVRERLGRVQQIWSERLKPSFVTVSRNRSGVKSELTTDGLELDARTFILGLSSMIEANEQHSKQRATQTMRWMFGLVLGAGVAVILLVILGWSISKRVADLAKVANGFREGRIESLSSWESNTNDEIAVLGQAFQEMALHLQIVNETSERERIRMQTIMNSVSDALITIDHKGVILTANTSVERLLGYRTEEIIGKNVSMLTPSPHRENHDSYLARYMSTGHARVVGIEREVEASHKNGTLVPVSLRVSRMETESGTQFVGLIQDISQRTVAQQAQVKLNRSISEAATSVGIASRRIVAAISDQSRSSQNQAASIAETVAAAEEVTQISSQSAANANAVADVAHRADNLGKSGRSSVKQNLTMMASVKKHSDKIGLSVRALAQQANAIGEIIASVNDVAEQTNLLALNAAIEASRAGEHGRGFSVVAGEVKALAQQSKKATAQVRQILGEVQNATMAAVSASEEGSREVDNAMAVAEETGVTIDELAAALTHAAEVAEQISCSTSQGATGMSQINDAMKNINHAVESSMRAIHDVQTAANDLEEVGERLQELTQAS